MVSLCRRKHAVYIQLIALMSVVSLAIVSTSLGTQDWIRATANPKIEGPLMSDINYGLFRGTLVRRPVYSPYQFDLYIACIWGKNSCAWSCASTEDARKTEVQHLVDGMKPSFACIPTQSVTSSSGVKLRVTEGTNDERVFTNAGLWVSTIIFIVILMIALVGSLALSIINCIKSPIETFFNVEGIYITNALALGANFFVLLLYGICYDAYIKQDISIYDTVVGDYASEAALGYSYWILHVPCLFHALGIFLIAMRERIINSDRAETNIDIATETPATGVLF